MAFALVAARVTQAQSVPEKQPDGTYTLHVYTDLLQVPTLVLTRLHSSYKSLKAQSFTLSLNGGPLFHPTSVRLEGDDPVSLGIVFDRTTGAEPMFNAFANALSALPGGVLTPRDNISVYTYDCALLRTSTGIAADELVASMAKVKSEQADQKDEAACSSKKRLFDVIARVAEDFASQPGRKVILVISDGTDRQSANDWMHVAQYANSKSITIFGLRPVAEQNRPSHMVRGGTAHEGWVTVEGTDPFQSLCSSTGGLVLDAGPWKQMMTRQMERLISMLRNRYIIEFPRPVNGAPGQYSIEVMIPDPRAIVRPAGVAFPPRAEDAKAAEGTLPEDTSRLPVVGPKHDDNPANLLDQPK